MNNPRLKDVLVNFPDVDPASLAWPADADLWDAKDLEIFVGSGGFLKPKKGKYQKPAAKAEPAGGNGYTQPALPTAAVPIAAASAPSTELEDQPSAFEVPGFSKERHAITMPVRIHCEDTSPIGHVRLESLTAVCERIRSLALKQIMNVSLADLKERKLAILATEYVIEIVGKGIRVLDTLRIDTTPEFPSAPLFPWDTKLYTEDESLYAQGRFGLNLCAISDSGVYSGIEAEGYNEFVKDMRKWSSKHPVFSSTNLRFFNAYKRTGVPFKPSTLKQVTYVVRAADCDMYNVLFQARVPSFLESCHPRHDAMAFYVNIRMSVRPGDELKVHVFSNSDSALFICLRGKEAVLSAFGHYGADTSHPMRQEEIKCGSILLPSILKFCSGGDKPKPSEDLDLSEV
jgi:acyl-CoA thioesterase FadM